MEIDTVGSRHSSLLAIMSAGASRVMEEEELMKGPTTALLYIIKMYLDEITLTKLDERCDVDAEGIGSENRRSGHQQ